MSTTATCRRRPRRAPRMRRERGAFAIMFVPLLLVMIAMCGMALSLGMVYNRKAELHGVAKAAALAAARALDGTREGVTAAQARAREVAEGMAYQYRIPMRWNDNALTFSTSPDRSGVWNDAGNAMASPRAVYYVKVDTAFLDEDIGTVPTPLMAILSSSLSSVKVSHSAVAGRTAINVIPIAICAKDSAPYVARPSSDDPEAELVEYGFRRGVSYDLMRLSNGSKSPERYVVNPVLAPGWTSATFNTSTLGTFVCRGDMWIPRLTTGGTVKVSPLPATAPLADLYRYLNTRFDQFDAPPCSPSGANPAFNVKSFAYDQPGGVPWMVPATGNRSAASTTVRARLETVADPLTPPPGTTAGMYGPLWTFAKPVKYVSFATGGRTPPPGGYATFKTSDWPRLYPTNTTDPGEPASPTAVGHPDDIGYRMPYRENRPGSPNFQQSMHPLFSREERRAFNMPLLQCPVNAGSNVSVRVSAIGRFYMTVPATPDSLIAEFGGEVAERTMSPEVGLFP